MQPNYPAQQYPQAPPAGYPTQYPQAPQNPYAGPGYGAPAMYPPAQYPVAQAPYGAPAGPPVPPPVPGSLESFYGAPSTSGGPSWKFQGKPIGTTYAGVVERPVTDADIRQQTNNAGVPQTYRDGRPKFIMVVPMLVPQSAEFTEGRAGWWVKGQARDELVRAMSEAGAPAGPPEAGALIQVTLTGQRQIPNMNPQYIYRVVYTRPTGDPAQAVAAMAPAAPAPMAQPAYVPGIAGYPVPALNIGPTVTPPAGYPAQYAAPPAQPVYAAPAAQYGPPVQGQPAQPVYAPAQPVQYAAPVAAVPAPVAMAAVAAGQPAPVAQPAGLGGLTADQQALMATLVGQPA